MKQITLFLLLVAGLAVNQLSAQSCCQPCPPGCCVSQCAPSAKSGKTTAVCTPEQQAACTPEQLKACAEAKNTASAGLSTSSATASAKAQPARMAAVSNKRQQKK